MKCSVLNVGRNIIKNYFPPFTNLTFVVVFHFFVHNWECLISGRAEKFILCQAKAEAAPIALIS